MLWDKDYSCSVTLSNACSMALSLCSETGSALLPELVIFERDLVLTGLRNLGAIFQDLQSVQAHILLVTPINHKHNMQ